MVYLLLQALLLHTHKNLGPHINTAQKHSKTAWLASKKHSLNAWLASKKHTNAFIASPTVSAATLSTMQSCMHPQVVSSMLNVAL